MEFIGGLIFLVCYLIFGETFLYIIIILGIIGILLTLFENKEKVVMQHLHLLKKQLKMSKKELSELKWQPNLIKILKNHFHNFSEENKIILISKYPEILKKIKTPQEKILIKAIENNYKVIFYIYKTNKEMIENAMLNIAKSNINYNSISSFEVEKFIEKNINNISDNIQLEFVKNKPETIFLIKEPSKKLIVVSIKNILEKNIKIYNNSDYEMIKFIQNHINGLDEKLQLKVIEKYPKLLSSITNPSGSFIEKFFFNYLSLNDKSHNNIMLEFIKEHIDNLSEKLQLKVIEKYPELLSYITNPSKSFTEKIVFNYLSVNDENIMIL